MTIRSGAPALLCSAVLAAATLSGMLAGSAVASSPPAGHDVLADEIRQLIGDALTSDTWTWDIGGTAVRPTGIDAAVRVPGREDMFVAAGTNVDGSPVDAHAPFPTGGLGSSVLVTLALQLIDEGTLDPDATVESWAPDLPNADRVTVSMLLNSMAGWGDDTNGTANITADLTRAWTPQEVVAAAAPVPAAEPGTFDRAGAGIRMAVLATVLEALTGTPWAELVEQRIAGPLGLEGTFVQHGDDQPAGYQHGMFLFDGTVTDTSSIPNTAYYTYSLVDAVVSTGSDLLDLLDGWMAGALFTTQRVPGPTTLLGSRLVHLSGNGHDAVLGYDSPVNGYCPCEPAGAGDGLTVSAFGRKTNAVGTELWLVQYADGVDVVVHLNSNEATEADEDRLDELADAIHHAAVG